MAMNVRPSTLHAAFAVALAGILAGCQQETVREIDWAKAALARNPAYEIVATDETAGVFTVRDTTTGDVSTLKLGDLIATPRQPANAAPAPEPENDPENVPEDDPQHDDADRLASSQTTEAAPLPPESGVPLAQGPGYSITRATGSKPEASAEPLEGPGYRIEKSGIEKSGVDRSGNTSTPRQAVAGTPDMQAASGEPRTDPIICQGDRLMRIDGETLSFTGDAVIAEKGCDLYISNARIRAGGVGIIARQARVHIANSIISGMRGSYEASEGAEIYVAQSTFTGIGRRFDNASMTDLGGNSYATH
jgi:hypothetical protein